MSMPEAAQLVIQAGSMAMGGDVFLLEMGEPVKIINLARRMIELSGQSVLDSNNLDGDIEIKITGLRPGEKLYEELLISNNPEPTIHAKIMKANEQYMSWEELEPKIKALEMALNINDVKVIRLMLTELVTGYKPTEEIVDWVYVENFA
jgi:FlaA1/EpsC-like NDP-sugar epimerase